MIRPRLALAAAIMLPLLIQARPAPAQEASSAPAQEASSALNSAAAALLDGLSALRDDAQVSQDFDVQFRGQTKGSVSLIVAADQAKGQPCYRVESTMSAGGPGGRTMHFVSYVAPDLTLLYSEQIERQAGNITQSITVSRDSQGTYIEVTSTGGDESIETYAAPRGLLHNGVEVLVVFLLDPTRPESYQFPNRQSGGSTDVASYLVTGPETVVVGDRECRAMRVTHVEVSLDDIQALHGGQVPLDEAVLFWLDATSGELLMWGMGDESSGMRMLPR
jgi:hypothetical protein